MAKLQDYDAFTASRVPASAGTSVQFASRNAAQLTPAARSIILAGPMHRAPLLEALGSYEPYNTSDGDACRRTTEFVRSHSDCFERDLAIGHINRVGMDCFCLSQQGASYASRETWPLASARRPRRRGARRVGGGPSRSTRRSRGWRPFAWSRREYSTWTFTKFPPMRKNPRTFTTIFVFCWRPTRIGLLSVSSESKDLRWIAVENLPTFGVDDSVSRLARKAALANKSLV